MLQRAVFVAGMAILSIAGSSSANAAAVFGFNRITANAPTNVAGQLFVTVDDAGTAYDNFNILRAQVGFTFRNFGGTASKINNIYFDDGTLLGGIKSITNSTYGTVNFSVLKNAGNLPGSNTFNTTKGFTATPDPGQDNAVVNSTDVINYEWVRIVFMLQGSLDYLATISAMELSLLSPGVDVTNGLRIGLHVQGIGVNSDSFINGGQNPNPPFSLDPVPEPASMAMWLTVAVGGAFVARRKSKKTVC